MIEEVTAEHLAVEVERAAKATARKWPEVVEADDVYQDIWLKLLESANYVPQIKAMEPDQRKAALLRIGHEVAVTEREAYAAFSGNIFYGTREVRRILDQVNDPEDDAWFLGNWTEETEDGPINVLPASPGDTPGSATRVAAADLAVGISHLFTENRPHYDTLVEAYVFRTLDRSASESSNRLSRAVEALTRAMNHNRRAETAA